MKKIHFLLRSLALVMLCAWMLSNSVLAGDIYHCVIQDQIQAAYSGHWSRGNMQVANQNVLQFIVNRLNGRVMGDVFDNHDAQRVEILDSGSDQQAFKLLAVFGPNISVDYLQIKEYHLQADKPFTGMSQGKAYTGVCHRKV